MDETIFDYPDYRNIEVRAPLPIPDEGTEDREELSKNPSDMLSISLSRKEKLPEDLHQAMVMWSFHPDHQSITKFYFNWVDLVEYESRQEGFFRRIAKAASRFLGC